MSSIQIESIVDQDGIVVIQVPREAIPPHAKVLVTVQSLENRAASMSREQWQQFVKATYGSCAGLGLERGDQGTLERREPLL
jgi:hypothetical protein